MRTQGMRGVMMLQASNSSDGVVLGIETADQSYAQSCGGNYCDSADKNRTPGTLFAYNATPNSASEIVMLWNTAPYNGTTNAKGCTSTDCPQTWCASSFALPTVANGLVYVPVYAINNDGTQNCPDNVPGTSSSYLSGIPDYTKK
jgi:hypothetical protein